MKALREVGCHDADAWVDGVRDFPKVRGDRFLVLVEFNWEGKPQVYSLDELIGFQGWGDSAGPYGFMFKGDPGKKDPNPKTLLTYGKLASVRVRPRPGFGPGHPDSEIST